MKILKDNAPMEEFRDTILLLLNRKKVIVSTQAMKPQLMLTSADFGLVAIKIHQLYETTLFANNSILRFLKEMEKPNEKAK